MRDAQKRMNDFFQKLVDSLSKDIEADIIADFRQLKKEKQSFISECERIVREGR